MTTMPVIDIVGPASDGRDLDGVLVADSWLVSEGRVRGIDLHRQRFFAAGKEIVDEARLWAFWREMVAALPREGEWFPRVEIVAPSALRLRIRPAPPRDADVRVWVSHEADRRTEPRRKGPDLALLARVRGRAAKHEAQEALLTTRNGYVLEAAAASVLWWEDDVLCVPSPLMRTLPGITTELITQRARELGIEVGYRRRPLAHLAGRETWLVNALHGIRPVTEWVGARYAAGPPARAAAWRPWLEGQRVALE